MCYKLAASELGKARPSLGYCRHIEERDLAAEEEEEEIEVQKC